MAGKTHVLLAPPKTAKNHDNFPPVQFVASVDIKIGVIEREQHTERSVGDEETVPESREGRARERKCGETSKLSLHDSDQRRNLLKVRKMARMQH